MHSKKTSSLTKMDKIRIVVEYNELSEDKKPGYLQKNGIDLKTLQAYQQEAATVIGGGLNSSPPPPKTRCEELIENLQSSNENVRRDAAKELGALRHRATSAIDMLIDRMLNDSIDFVRTWSAWALTRIEPRNPDVIDAFLKNIAEDEHTINARNWCVVGISVSESDRVRDHLIKILKTGKSFAQFSSIEALSRMGIKSTEFIEALKAATDSENQSVQELARLELSKINTSG